MMTDSAQYARLAVSWDDDQEPQTAALLTPDLLQRIAHHAGVASDPNAQEKLRDALLGAMVCYSEGAFDVACQRSEKEDNAALERVALKAQELYDAILDLQEYPGIEPRVAHSIRSFPHPHKTRSGVTLAHMTRDGRNVLRDYRDLLMDFRTCVENVTNRKPKPEILDPIDEDDAPLRLDSDEELAEALEAWRAQSKVRKFPKDHALQCFLAALRPAWKALSPHPFTEGMYHADQGQTVSRLVDAIELVMARLDPAVTRSEIVNALRKTRKAGTGDTAS